MSRRLHLYIIVMFSLALTLPRTGWTQADTIVAVETARILAITCSVSSIVQGNRPAGKKRLVD